jgi:hypothetical protein
VRRRRLQILFMSVCLAAGMTAIAASLVVPILLLLRLSDKQLNRWSEIGQALSPIGIFFSGVAFIGVAVALIIQQRELKNQHDEISIAREEQARASEVVIRQLHTDLIKMAIEDPELLAIWPAMAPGIAGSKKDQYCNLILNLQKVAYETHAVELAELRGALRFLMTSRDMYMFWERARTARIAVTGGDEGEDFFTTEVDRAFNAASPPGRRTGGRLRSAFAVWRRGSHT